MDSVLARPEALVIIEPGAVWGSELLRMGVREAVPASSEASEFGLFCLVATAKGSFLSSHLERRRVMVSIG